MFPWKLIMWSCEYKDEKIWWTVWWSRIVERWTAKRNVIQGILDKGVNNSESSRGETGGQGEKENIRLVAIQSNCIFEIRREDMTGQEMHLCMMYCNFAEANSTVHMGFVNTWANSVLLHFILPSSSSCWQEVIWCNLHFSIPLFLYSFAQHLTTVHMVAVW